MGKLTINASPTFKAKVGIPIPGADPVEVEFTFKHRTKDQLNDFIKTRADKTDAQSLMDMVSAWDFAEELTIESAHTMLQNYMGAAVEVYRTYVRELAEAKVKN
jgi:hypothetical protein